MTAISFDIETRGTRVGAKIISLGACTLDEQHTFYVNIDHTQYGPEFHDDESTLEWWNKPEHAEALLQTKTGDLLTPTHAFNRFADWLREHNVTSIWAKPPSFDVSLTEEVFRLVGVEWPVTFRAPRCLRTLLDVSGFDEKTIPLYGTPHNALDDAIHQARVINAALASLRS